MARQYDLYRRDEPRQSRPRRKSMSPARMWQAVGLLFVIWSAIAAVVWLVGYDFTAEATHRKMKVCGFARFVLPDILGQAVPCVWWNLSAFYVMPVVAAVFALKKSLSR